MQRISEKEINPGGVPSRAFWLAKAPGSSATGVEHFLMALDTGTSFEALAIRGVCEVLLGKTLTS